MAECIDLTAQTWREAEIVACARLRLLTARGAYDAARELAAALGKMAAERGLVRTRMRGLALAMVLEHRAGDDARARAHLVAYLRLFAEADYARPLARERAVALALLDDVAAAPAADAAVAAAAEGLRASLRDDAGQRPETPFSRRELEVLALPERHRDKEIGRIFAKLGARGRLDAVHRARAQGLLPPVDGARRRSRYPVRAGSLPPFCRSDASWRPGFVQLPVAAPNGVQYIVG